MSPVSAGAFEVAGGSHFYTSGSSAFVSFDVVPSRVNGSLAISKVTEPLYQPSHTLKAPMRQISTASSTTKKFGPTRGIATRMMRIPFPVRESRSGKLLSKIIGLRNSPHIIMSANIIVRTVCTKKSVIGVPSIPSLSGDLTKYLRMTVKMIPKQATVLRHLNTGSVSLA